MPSFDSITDIRIAPMHSLEIYLSSIETIYFEHPEADSNYEFTEVKQPNGFGGGDVVAYRLDITWILPYAALQDLFEDALRKLARNTIATVALTLLPVSGQSAGATIILGSPERPVTVADWTYEWRTNKAQLRPRTELKLHGLFSLDALGEDDDIYPSFFHQFL